MNKIISTLFSMNIVIILILTFAASIGYATFIENDYGTITAKAEVYNAKWFEGLLALLALSLVLNIFKYKMYTLKKAPLFLFHAAFLIILFGAAVTRYVGFEGTMHIREGDSSSTLLSANSYIVIDATSHNEKKNIQEPIYLSKKSNNTFSNEFTIDNKKVSINLTSYLPDVIESIIEDKNGVPIAKMMVTGNGAKGQAVALEYGNYYDAGNFILDFNTNESFSKPVIKIYMKNDELFMNHDMKLSFFRMDDRKEGKLEANDDEVFDSRVLYSTDLGSFVLREFMPKARKELVTNPNSKLNASGLNVLKFTVDVDGKSEMITVFGKDRVKGISSDININGTNIEISYGSIEIPLDFKITLNDFQLDRYPGSMSPSSYASEVILSDEKENVEMPYRIFMNNILDYKGYRFFQASYDRDEKGTVLSVNNDPGTLPSYIGYFLLALGMFWALFSKKQRVAKLGAKAKKMSESKIPSFLLALGLLFSIVPNNLQAQDEKIKTILSFDQTHSQKFGNLISQDSKGRMKPIDTLSTEIMAKVHGSASLKVDNKTLSANQVVLGMMIKPNAYKYIDLIKTKDAKINKLLGISSDSKYASFADFFLDPIGMRGYKLQSITNEAARKEPKHRNKLDKAALKIDEKVNVVYMVFSGRLVKIWPKPNDAGNKWFPTIEALQVFENSDRSFIQNTVVEYFLAIGNALNDKNWEKADIALDKISKYQIKHGQSVYPSANKIKAEIFYNHQNIFEKLYPIYLLLGFILLVLSFVKIIKPRFNIQFTKKIAFYSLAVLFIAHTVGLILRWYISGHAPWSNGYESMIYISWATVLAGFIFSKHSPMTLASTSILTGLILFVAHLNWMNPQVTNLVPVLNSYWLSIHVSMITASYGFLGLGALLGFINILLFIIKSKKNVKQISLSIQELNAITEMTLITGLFLLSVGNFLGGVWANESWGRYWGWDPKETWALVTILVYAAVLHVRFIKRIYSQFLFSVLALLSFTSVLMTYFGVNYYLAGMHSYAKGDPVPIPDFVPITYAIIFIVIIFAFRNRKIV